MIDLEVKPKVYAASTGGRIQRAVKKQTQLRQKASSQRIPAITEKQTRIEIVQTISDNLNMTRVDVEAVFDQLANLVSAHLGKRGSGEFMIPKLGLKLRRVRRKATKKRVMYSPLTGEEVVIAAKPARDDVKITALKALKERVQG